jgi:hemolysin III
MQNDADVSPARTAHARPSVLRSAPLLRGVLVQYAFYGAIVIAVTLLLLASSARSRAAMAIYSLGLAGCLGTSALYHRGHWSPEAKEWLSRMDRSMIFLLVAGTFTPVCLLAMTGWVSLTVMLAVWGGAAAGIGLTLLWHHAPRWAEVIPYLILGWLGLITVPQVIHGLGWTAFGLLLGGGVLYSLGAFIYAVERPDPWPRVFGFHELFHCFVVAAAGSHLAVIAFFVLPYSSRA